MGMALNALKRNRRIYGKNLNDHQIVALTAKQALRATATAGETAFFVSQPHLPYEMDFCFSYTSSNDALKVIDSVQRFHLCILEKTGNPLLLDTGKRLIVPLLAFTRMRVQARNLDASPWVPEVSNHQRILDALRMGDPHLAERTVVHITGLFLKAALAVWASG